MKLDDDNLDDLLKDHLDRSLATQLGRVEAAFNRELLNKPPQSNLRMPLWIAGVIATTAAAAVWAVALMRPQITPHSPRAGSSDPVQLVQAAGAERAMQYTAFTQTLDDGVVYLDDETPVHQLRRQAVQQVQWMDDDGKTQMKLTVPAEQVLLVEYTKN